jgi:hypothetical protein
MPTVHIRLDETVISKRELDQLIHDRDKAQLELANLKSMGYPWDHGHKANLAAAQARINELQSKLYEERGASGDALKHERDRISELAQMLDDEREVVASLRAFYGAKEIEPAPTLTGERFYWVSGLPDLPRYVKHNTLADAQAQAKEAAAKYGENVYVLQSVQRVQSVQSVQSVSIETPAPAFKIENL